MVCGDTIFEAGRYPTGSNLIGDVLPRAAQAEKLVARNHCMIPGVYKYLPVATLEHSSTFTINLIQTWRRTGRIEFKPQRRNDPNKASLRRIGTWISPAGHLSSADRPASGCGSRISITNTLLDSKELVSRFDPPSCSELDLEFKSGLTPLDKRDHGQLRRRSAHRPGS